MASRGLTVADVSTALRSQNILAGAGTLGQSPIPPGQSYEIPLRVNAREELSAGNLGILIFGFGIIMVFLTLAAQYESYIDPAIILLTVPLALLGALNALALRGLVNDVYANVALVMLIGLASKNAILIVEFANQALEEGMTIRQAAVTAAQERFRPIVMTSSASLLGFFPLVIATGAGSASRWSLGTALFGGLLVATILSLLIVPVLYVIIKTLEERFLKNKPANRSQPPSADGNQDGNQDGQSRAIAHQHSSVIVKQNADDNRRNDSSK